MRGQMLSVWGETWREIWKPLSEHPDYGNELIADLYRELIPPPTPPEMPPPEHPLDDAGELAHPDDIAARDEYETRYATFQDEQARHEETIAGRGDVGSAFRGATRKLVTTEKAAVDALEAAFGIVVNYGSDEFSNKYFVRVNSFLQKYSLRYDLRRPFSLHPTLPGLFTQLLTQLRELSDTDAHLSGLMNEFEDSLRDLKAGTTAGRIKTCMTKQFNLIEAISQRHPEATQDTLGAICGEIHTWPHTTLKEAAKKLYGFRSNYPGLGHAGNAASVLREIEMRDLVAVSVLLVGLAPYLSDELNPEIVYRGC